jgi:hypothetical protein
MLLLLTLFARPFNWEFFRRLFFCKFLYCSIKVSNHSNYLYLSCVDGNLAAVRDQELRAQFLFAHSMPLTAVPTGTNQVTRSAKKPAHVITMYSHLNLKEHCSILELFHCDQCALTGWFNSKRLSPCYSSDSLYQPHLLSQNPSRKTPTIPSSQQLTQLNQLVGQRLNLSLIW